MIASIPTYFPQRNPSTSKSLTRNTFNESFQMKRTQNSAFITPTKIRANMSMNQSSVSNLASSHVLNNHSPTPSLASTIHSSSPFNSNDSSNLNRSTDWQDSSSTPVSNMVSPVQRNVSPYIFIPLQEDISLPYNQEFYSHYGAPRLSNPICFSDTFQSNYGVQPEYQIDSTSFQPVYNMHTTSSDRIVPKNYSGTLQHFNNHFPSQYQSSFQQKKEALYFSGMDPTYKKSQPSVDIKSSIGFPPLPQSVVLSKNGMDKSNSHTKKIETLPQNCKIPESPPSPLPQNLKGDPHRQAKVKSELCIHYLRGSMCPFGHKCNYAHGEDELKYTKLIELKHSGLVENIKHYRTHPCFSWVATGACPFGQRCHSIHDPSICGSTASWLPHTDIPVSNLQSVLNVDKFFHRNLNSLNQDNPLVHPMIWNSRPSLKNEPKKKAKTVVKRSKDAMIKDCNGTEWDETYAIVCNMDTMNLSPLDSSNTRKKMKPQILNNGITIHKVKEISELIRISIALLMSYSTQDDSSKQFSHRDYIYNPTHLIYNKLCMVIQTRYFLIKNKENKLSRSLNAIENIAVKEISEKEYNARNSPWKLPYPYTPQDIIIVRELAFGPIGDSSSKVSLWFDILPSDVESCTTFQIKRYKRLRHRCIQQKKLLNHNSHDADKLFSESPFPESEHDPLLMSLHDESELSRPLNDNSFTKHDHQAFFHVQPISDDNIVYDLIRSMLLHRVNVIISRELTGESFAKACDLFSFQEMQLQKSFETVKRHLTIWKWPISVGREITTPETPVPRCSTSYCVSDHSPNAYSMWKSFQSGMTNIPAKDKQNNNIVRKGRLKIFNNLSNGITCNNYVTIGMCKKKSESLPHINSHSDQPTLFSFGKKSDAWKSLICDDTNDWRTIQDYFLRSLSPESSNHSHPSFDKNTPSSREYVEKDLFFLVPPSQ